MKKLLSYTLFAGLAVLGVVSCKKNNYVIDKDPLTPPSFAKFNTYTNGDTIKTYYIKSTNEPYKIPVGFNTVSDQDRTVQLSYSSRTAVQGQQYNAPASITIKAGQTIDSLAIQGLFAGYPSSSKIDTVKVTITGGDAPASAYKNNFYVILRKYCDVNIETFLGEYNHSYDGNYGPYTISVDSAVQTSATTGYLKVRNLWDTGNSTDLIRVDLNWANPANFTTNIPTGQFLYTDATYGAARVKPNGNGTFSSCENTFTLKYQVYVAAGNFSATTTTMAR